MLRISWKGRITNDEVYRRMGTGKSLLWDIKFSWTCVMERRTVTVISDRLC